MPLKLTARHMDVSDELREWVKGKVSRFHKYHDKITAIEVTVDRGKRGHSVDMQVRSGKTEFHCSVANEELRAAIDEAIHKMTKQLEKRRHRMIDKKKNATGGPPIDLPDAASFVQKGDTPAWIHPETIDPQPYSMEDALQKLEKMDNRNFFVFKHLQDGCINVIFKRSDDKIGLIEI